MAASPTPFPDSSRRHRVPMSHDPQPDGETAAEPLDASNTSEATSWLLQDSRGTQWVGPLDADAETLQPVRIPRHQIDSVIGRGGMGEVYAARQTEPFERPVAVKVIRPGLGGRNVVTRFEGERQTLAQMEHANIARVYDAGVTADGRPYFTMEHLSDARPITQYCDARRLTVRERVELFRQACRAVEHAHQRGVIHRDLKPGNVLVTESPGHPAVKVIDFGLAKAIAGVTADTLSSLSEVGQIVGTVRYMSPEQAELDPGRLDTRSDVFALGLLLFELCAGQPPPLPDGIDTTSVEGVLVALREGTPPRLSDVTAAGSRRIARARSTTPRRLRVETSGDLAQIVAKALANDREQRYGSPRELDEDLGRYLAGEVVAATRATPFYRLRKFVRRHRAAVVSAGILAVSLIAGVGYSLDRKFERTRESMAEAQRRAEQQRKIADSAVQLRRAAEVNAAAASRNARRAEEIAIEEEELRRQADRSRDVTLQTLERVVDQMQRRLDRAGSLPEARIELLAGAADALQRVSEIAGPQDPEIDRLAGIAAVRQSGLYRLAGREARAVAAAAQAVDRFESAWERVGDHETSKSLVSARRLLADLRTITGRLAEAERGFRRAIDEASKLPDSGDTAMWTRSERSRLLTGLARTQLSAGRPADAAATLDEDDRLQERLDGDRAAALRARCDLFLRTGRPEDAIATAKAIPLVALDDLPAASRQEVLQRCYLDRSMSRVWLRVGDSQKALAAARRSLRAAEEALRRQPGSSVRDRDVMFALSRSAEAALAAGHLDEAAGYARRQGDVFARVYPPQEGTPSGPAPFTETVDRVDLALLRSRLAVRQGQPAEALRHLEEASRVAEPLRSRPGFHSAAIRTSAAVLVTLGSVRKEVGDAVGAAEAWRAAEAMVRRYRRRLPDEPDGLATGVRAAIGLSDVASTDIDGSERQDQAARAVELAERLCGLFPGNREFAALRQAAADRRTAADAER